MITFRAETWERDYNAALASIPVELSESEREEICRAEETLDTLLKNTNRPSPYSSADIILPFVNHSPPLPDIPDHEESFEDDAFIFPESISALYKTAASALDYIRGLFNGAVNDVLALQVKAMKYRALMQTLNNSFKELRLPYFEIQEEPDPLLQLNHLRETFEVSALTLIRSKVTSALLDPKDEVSKRYFKVCFELYTQNSLEEANQALLNSLFSLPAAAEGGDIVKKVSSANNLVAMIDNSKTALPPARWFRSIVDDIGSYFSPIGNGNPPQKMFELLLGGPEKAVILGCGSPTIQELDPRNAQVDPLFIGYLEYLRSCENKKKHFFISNQNGRDKEQWRNRHIMKLQEEYADVFLAITQTKNGSFYKGQPEDMKVDAQILIRDLHCKFFNSTIEESGCFLPDSLKKDAAFDEWSREVLSAILREYFAETPFLSQQEQKLIVELYYAMQILKIAQDQHISFLNLTCKDGIDRGMGSLAWLLILIQTYHRQDESKDTEEMLRRILFTRAYWTRKRNIIMERLMRVLDDVSTLRQLDPSFDITRRLFTAFIPSMENIRVNLLC